MGLRSPGTGALDTPSWGILSWVRCSRQATSLPMKSSRYSQHYVLFLKQLREARLQAGLSQLQLAEALGQRQTFVSKCELGDRRLDVIELRDWVVALGGDPTGFMAGLEERLSRNSRLPMASGSRGSKRAVPKIE